MKKKSSSKSGFFTPRFFVAFTLCSLGMSFVVLAIAAPISKKIFSSKPAPTAVNNAAGAVIPTISQPLRNLPTVNQLTTVQTEIGDTERQLFGRQIQNPSVQDPVVQTAA